MKQIIALIMLFLAGIFLIGCCAKKKSTSPVSTTKTTLTLPEKVSFSSGFMQFWNDLKKDLDDYDINNYTPGEAFIQKYKLRKVDDIYIVSGFIKTKPDFEATSVEGLGGVIANYTETLNTFRIPLNKLPEMIWLEGIERVELATNIRIKR